VNPFHRIFVRESIRSFLQQMFDKLAFREVLLHLAADKWKTTDGSHEAGICRALRTLNTKPRQA